MQSTRLPSDGGNNDEGSKLTDVRLKRAAAGSVLFRLLRPAIVLLGILTLMTGGIYPLMLLGFGSLFFAQQAGGSLVERGGRVIGSTLIGQSFSAPSYFWGRPSATTPAYNAASSSGSNLGPINPALSAAIAARVMALHRSDPANRLPVPVDLVTASGSGLDPDISVAAARYQAARVAGARGVPVTNVAGLIDSNRVGPQLGILGEPRVNVLRLNLALDASYPLRQETLR